MIPNYSTNQLLTGRLPPVLLHIGFVFWLRCVRSWAKLLLELHAAGDEETSYWLPGLFTGRAAWRKVCSSQVGLREQRQMRKGHAAHVSVGVVQLVHIRSGQWARQHGISRSLKHADWKWSCFWKESKPLSETARRLRRTDQWSRQKSLLLTVDFQTGNRNLKITLECCRKEENNPNCPEQKWNALHTHTQTTFLLFCSSLWLSGK